MSNRAIRYRLYPDKEQRILIGKTFGCCRKVWNLMLADKDAAPAVMEEAGSSHFKPSG